MLTIDIDEWEWYDRFDHTMLNLLAVMLRHQSAEVERLREERGCEDGECRLALLSEVERLEDKAAYLHGHNVSLMAEVKRLTWMMSQVHVLDRTEHSCPRCDRMWADLASRYNEWYNKTDREGSLG